MAVPAGSSAWSPQSVEESEKSAWGPYLAPRIEGRQSCWCPLFSDCAPSNNAAERDLRKAVLWRNVSLGSQSEKGFRFVERILTAVESLRAQGRDILGFLVDTMSAAAQGRGPTSLMPVMAAASPPARYACAGDAR